MWLVRCDRGITFKNTEHAANLLCDIAGAEMLYPEMFVLDFEINGLEPEGVAAEVGSWCFADLNASHGAGSTDDPPKTQQSLVLPLPQ